MVCFKYSMEGFVHENSVFKYGLKYSNCYTDYGVTERTNPKYKPEETSTNTQNQPNNLIGMTFRLPDISEMDEYIPTSLNDLDKTVVDTVTTPSTNNKHRIKKAVVVGGSAALLGGLSLVLSRGKITSKTTKPIGKFIENIQEKIENIKEKPSISEWEGLYLSGLQKLNKGLERVRGTLCNYTPLKDSLFSKVAYAIPILRKPCDAITNGFRKLSFATVKSSYKKASNDLSQMNTAFENMNRRILKGEFAKDGVEIDKSAIDTINSRLETINTTFQSSFGEQELEKRNTTLINKFKGLDKKVYNTVYGKGKEFIADVDAWSTFIPEKLVEKDKARIIRALADKKRIITNNPNDNYKSMTEIVNEFDKVIDQNNKDSRIFVKRLKELIKSYGEISGDHEARSRVIITNDINKTLKSASEIIENVDYPPEKKKALQSLISRLGRTLNTDKKGAIEEILSEYKNLLPRDEYNELKKVAQKASESLNKAVNHEGSDYVDKSRDLAIGSALTDIAIGMAVPMGATAIAMSAADTQEKKRSVLLKYGIPLGVGIATSTVATIRLIAGGKALMLATLTATIANNICEKIDDYLIKRSNKEQQAG